MDVKSQDGREDRDRPARGGLDDHAMSPALSQGSTKFDSHNSTILGYPDQLQDDGKEVYYPEGLEVNPSDDKEVHPLDPKEPYPGKEAYPNQEKEVYDAEPIPNSPRKSKRILAVRWKVLWAIVGVVLLLAVGLGAGLGAGLKKHHQAYVSFLVATKDRVLILFYQVALMKPKHGSRKKVRSTALVLQYLWRRSKTMASPRTSNPTMAPFAGCTSPLDGKVGGRAVPKMRLSRQMREMELLSPQWLIRSPIPTPQ